MKKNARNAAFAKRVCPMQVTEMYDEKGEALPFNLYSMFPMCGNVPYADTLKVEFAGKTVFKSRNWLEPSYIE
jgi:hypothetical protein